MLFLWLLLVLLPGICFSADIVINNDKCRHCQFLVDTFQEGLKKTARHHFAGGDTAWEEKNLGKYATSETRLIEVMEGLCKKKSLSNTDKYNGLSELEFKCSLVSEEHEETIEEYYYKHQDYNMSGWLCIQQLKICCADGHFGADCSKCPGLEQGAAACYGHGQCHGEGSRQGTGKCKCDTGYVGHMCRHCDADYFEAEKTDASITCERCFTACVGGCKSAGPTGCTRCRSGWEQSEMDGCVDVDECLATPSPCQRQNEKCVNNPGSFTCECLEGYKREGEECALDIQASPVQPWIRPDLLLRFISMSSLAAIITLVVWRRSTLLMVICAIAVVLILIIEVNVNPDSIPDETKKYLPY